MNETLREMCKSLRLAYVADIYNQIPYESADQFLEAVFKEEFRLREEAKVQRLIKKAKFLDTKRLANYEWYEQKSLIITSNLEFSQWNRIFVDARLTAALVDRLIHHAHALSFTGESYRLSHALSKSR